MIPPLYTCAWCGKSRYLYPSQLAIVSPGGTFHTRCTRQRAALEPVKVSDGVAFTLEEIGTYLGISRERVRQIEEDAIHKLRRKLDAAARTLGAHYQERISVSDVVRALAGPSTKVRLHASPRARDVRSVSSRAKANLVRLRRLA